MRVVLSSFLVLLLQRLSFLHSFASLPVVVAEEDAPKEGKDDDEDLDLDLDEDLDLEEGDMSADGASSAADVEDFDKDMPEADRTVRMKACFTVTVARLQSASTGIDQLVQQVMQQKPGTQKEQAVNLILFNWMMTCYFNIEPDQVKTLSESAAGEAVPKELVQGETLFSPQMDKPQTPQTASKIQWSLLEGVLQEHSKTQQEAQKKAKKSQTPGSSPGGQQASEEPAEPFFNKMLKVALPFTLIFGVLGLGTMMLMKKEKEAKGKKEKKEKKKKN